KKAFQVFAVGSPAINPFCTIEPVGMATSDTVDARIEITVEAPQADHTRTAAHLPQIAPACAPFIDKHTCRRGGRESFRASSRLHPVINSCARVQLALVDNHRLHRVMVGIVSQTPAVDPSLVAVVSEH